MLVGVDDRGVAVDDGVRGLRVPAGPGGLAHDLGEGDGAGVDLDAPLEDVPELRAAWRAIEVLDPGVGVGDVSLTQGASVRLRG